MHFRIERDGDISFIHPVGKFDGGTECEPLQMLVADMAESGCRKVVFSFSQTSWINSCGVGKIIAAKFVMDENNGRFILCNLRKRNMTIINTLRLDQVFEIHETIQEAIAALEQDSLTQTTF